MLNSEPLISARGFRPEEDGQTHINIYSASPTQLGRWLSHFTHTPFVHPYLGPFACMEGFWYFMRNGQVDDELRYLAGHRAKIRGREGKPQWYANFKEDIMAANYCKVIQRQPILDALKESTLPFDHYYLFGGRNGARKVLINAKDNDWLIDGWSEIREAVKADIQPACWINAEKRYISKK